VIRFAVREAGPRFRRRTVARAGASLLQFKQRCAVKLTLRDEQARACGHVSIACEMLEVRQRNLIDILELAHARRQRDAFLISGAAPMVPGELIDGNGAGGETCEFPMDFPVGSPCSMPATPNVARLER